MRSAAIKIRAYTINIIQILCTPTIDVQHPRVALEFLSRIHINLHVDSRQSVARNVTLNLNVNSGFYPIPGGRSSRLSEK